MKEALKHSYAIMGLVLAVMGTGDSRTSSWGQDKGDFLRRDYPPIYISVRQESGQVHFEFFMEHDLHASKQKIRTEISLLAVHFAGKSPFWEIWEPTNVPKALAVTYGVLPPGFVQNVPRQGSAPALEKGVRYYVSADARGGFGHTSFVYEGR